MQTGITLQLHLRLKYLDTTVYKGERFHNQGILDIRTHFKPTETFQYTHFSSCNPHGVRKGLIKGEALRLLRTNSSAKSFYENIYNFKKRLRARGYPHNWTSFPLIDSPRDNSLKPSNGWIGNEYDLPAFANICRAKKVFVIRIFTPVNSSIRSNRSHNTYKYEISGVWCISYRRYFNERTLPTVLVRGNYLAYVVVRHAKSELVRR